MDGDHAGSSFARSRVYIRFDASFTDLSGEAAANSFAFAARLIPRSVSNALSPIWCARR